MPDENTQQTSQSSQGGDSQSQSTSGAASGGGSTQTQASGSQASQTSQQTQAAAPTRPDYLPEQFWDATAGKVKDKEFGEHYSQVAVRDAAEQVRRAALPQKPEDYKIGTTPAFKPPEGVEFAINENDPLWSQARTWAQKNGLSQDAFHEAVDLFAGAKVGEASQIQAARNAEIGKLGAAGTARVTALNTFFDGIGSPEMKQMLVTAGIIQAAEKLVAKFASQGSASFSQAHRDANQGGKVTDDEWAKMSLRERQEYSQRFDQTQFTRAN